MKTISKESCKELLINAFTHFPSESKKERKRADFEQLVPSDFDALATYIEETIGVSTTGKSIRALLKGAGAKNSTINIVCAFLLVKKEAIPVQDLNFEEHVADNRYYVRRYFESSEKEKQKQSGSEVSIKPQSANKKPFYKKSYFYIVGLLLFTIVSVSIYNATRTGTALPEIELSVADKSDYFPKEIKVRYDLKAEKFLKNARVSTMATPILLNKLKGEVYFNGQVPDFYRISLFSNQKLFDVEKILLPSNGWRAYLNRTERLPNEIYMVDGLMHLQDKSIITSPDEDYYTSFNIFEHFGVDGDNFTLEADIKNPPNEDSHWAYDISVDVIGYENPITFNFLSPDALKHANMVVGDTDFKVGDKQKVLQKLGILFPDWQHLTVICKDKRIKIMLDEQLIIDEHYDGQIGQIVGLQFYFKGLGYAKNVTLNGKSI